MENKFITITPVLALIFLIILVTSIQTYYSDSPITDMHGRLELAHAIGVLFPVITSYYGHKFFTFKI
jgi:hypothetical protein